MHVYRLQLRPHCARPQFLVVIVQVVVFFKVFSAFNFPHHSSSTASLSRLLSFSSCSWCSTSYTIPASGCCCAVRLHGRFYLLWLHWKWVPRLHGDDRGGGDGDCDGDGDDCDDGNSSSIFICLWFPQLMLSKGDRNLFVSSGAAITSCSMPRSL